MLALVIPSDWTSFDGRARGETYLKLNLEARVAAVLVLPVGWRRGRRAHFHVIRSHRCR